MFIKKVVLDGFKSYAQRTEISGFDPLFNAITGLNGSGKSNILDAICFLLGISNLAQVRAGSLQELVYKGGQAGVTKATVTITFDNRDKKQSPLGYESYDEITVSRQIVIGGRNKYLINGSNATPSRVQDLFRSVQLNINNPHFLIMQGRITKVLNMKPPEILSMIEEAAGTRMYESKRASAQKTIEKKDNKLKEIEVILVEEITPTLKRLKEERSSYLEYQKIMREVEHLSRLSVAFHFVQAENCRQESGRQLEELQCHKTDFESQIEQADQDIEDNLVSSGKLEKERDEEAHGPIQELEKKVDEAAKAKAISEATLKNSKDTLGAERRSHKSLVKSVEEDRNVLQSKEAEMAKGRGTYEELKARREAVEQAVETAQQHFQAVSAGLSSGAGGQEETLAAQKIACENAMSEAVTAAKQAEMRLHGAQSELKEKSKSSKTSEQSYLKDKASCDAARKEVERIERLMSQSSYQEGREEELQAKRDSLSVEINKLKALVDRLESRIPQVQFAYQDPYKGFKRDKVKGPVAKLVQVKDITTATALEVVAGGKLFNIVVDTEETAKDLLNRGRLKRRYTIIPLNKIAANSLSQDVVKKAQSLVGKSKAQPALSLVGYEEDLRPAMEYVFGSSLVCDSIENAKKVAFDRQVFKRSVTLTGDDFNPSGTLTGGSRNRSSSVLSQLQELCEAEGHLRQCETEMGVVRQELQDLQADASKYRRMQEQRDNKAHEAAIILTRLEQSTHHQQLTLVQQLKDTIEEQKQEVQRAKETEKSARERLKDVQQKMKDSKSHHERELKAAREEMARARKEAESVLGATGQQEQAMHTLELEVQELKTAIASQEQQIESCSANIAKKTEELEEQTKADAEAKRLLQETKRSLDEYKAVLRERTKELQKYEQKRKQLEKQKTAWSLEIKEILHNIGKVQKDSREAIQKVESMLTKYEWIATDKQFFGQPNTAYDFEAADMKEVSRRLGRMQEQKDKLGKSVNMRAMNMLGKAEEKYNDLLRKKTIVENDKAKIAELIKELDQKKNEALQGAYERVNKDFGSIFSTLLPGTSAKLSPPEGMTVLDGLEVKVAFSGVWKDSLQELSGGQRSLVALSLILAMLLFKPAPVYILDEVDAALDLSHTQNIGQMLRTHFKHSQFIVVSLKDGMFNNANVLFKTKFVDGVSTVTRYVNPKLQAASSASDVDMDRAAAADSHTLRKKAITGSHRAKKARAN